MTPEKIDNIAPLPCPVCKQAPVVRIADRGWRIACDNFHRHSFIAYGTNIESAALKWNNYVDNYRY